MLSDALGTLRTFEVFVAFRIGVANRDQPAWDPPTSAAWEEATHVAHGLHGRAEQMFQRITTAQVDAAFWRQRRELAEAANDLLDLGAALAAYRTRVDYLGVGDDGSGTWDLLDRAWQQWDTSAARWGLSRAEPIACGD